MPQEAAALADDYLLWAMEYVCAAGFDPCRLTAAQLWSALDGTAVEQALQGADGEVVRLDVRDGCLRVSVTLAPGRHAESRALRCPDVVPLLA